MASSNLKGPPSLSKSSCYDDWLKEIEIWQAFTGLATEKQEPTVFLTLEGKAREAILNMDIKKIKAKVGVENIVTELNKLYLKDKLEMAYETYDAFERFRRPADMSIKDYINEFECLLSKTKKFGTTMSPDILAYSLVKSANLEEGQEHLIRTTVKDLSYIEMQLQLKNIFGDGVTPTQGGVKIRTETDVFYEETEDDNEIFYQRRQASNKRFDYQKGRYQRGRYNKNGRGNGKGNVNNPRSTPQNPKRHRNPLDSYGNISRCRICESINRWKEHCPDKPDHKLSNTAEITVSIGITYSKNVATFHRRII